MTIFRTFTQTHPSVGHEQHPPVGGIRVWSTKTESVFCVQQRQCIVSFVCKKRCGGYATVHDHLVLHIAEGGDIVSGRMAVRGVWQLKKLVVCFCDHSGSSAGARDFVERIFPKFQRQNPQLEVTTQLVRGHHPHLRGFYVNRNERVVDVKNQNAEVIRTQVMRLRNSTGRKVVKLKTRHVTFCPSVQGTWTPELQI